MVAIHDSELTRALESMPATNGTPNAAGSSGFQWWTTNWHYFVMPDAIKESLRSDGTAFTTVSDADITAGNLLDTNGNPNYPIVISLASEAMRDDEIAPLTNYVAAGGYLFVGSSAFTRTPDGTTRGDFAIANQMGIHMVKPGLTNWTVNSTISRVSNSPLVNHIPAGQLTWQLPSAGDEISWPESAHVSNPPTTLPHLLWQVQSGGASVLVQGDSFPFMLLKSYGKGFFIYIATEQPMIAHGGWAPGMYSYAIFRNAIQLAFAAAQMPIPRVSAWPYNYDAAVMFRHDMEAIPAFIQSIENSARFEFTNGASGDYFFCTGELREDMPPNGATIASLQRAVSNYNATIGPHNGGFTNINPYNPALTTNDYDYWHWGPDEMLNSTPTNLLYPTGQAYALASISNSFDDIAGWLGAYTNNGSGLKLWVAPYFNATREGSFQIEEALGIQATGEQKAGPFPHWTISTQTPDKLYSFVSVPVSDWFVGPRISQAIEDGFDTNAIHAMVDFYYNMGALINLYSHSSSDGTGAAGGLASEYVLYSLAKPRIWSANTAALYNWWEQRKTVTVTPTFSTNGTQSSINLDISGSVDTNTGIEVYLPNSAYYNLQVFTNGVAATGGWRTNGQMLKISVGTAVTNAQVLYSLPPIAKNDFYLSTNGTPLTVAAPGVLGNDIAGSGGTPLTAALVAETSNGLLNLDPSGAVTYTPATNFTGVDIFTYEAVDTLTNSKPGQATLMAVPPGAFFVDTLTRPTNIISISPWVQQMGTWTITNNQLNGTAVSNSYGFAYYSNSTAWSDYTVQGSVQFTNVNAWGGGIGGRLNPATGAHYAAWIYPDGSGGGSKTLKLIKFEGWALWSFTPMANVSVPAVGTNAHTLRITFKGSNITVSFDGVPEINLADPNFDFVPPLTGGGIVADFFNAGNNFNIAVDNVSAAPFTAPQLLGVNLTNNAAVVMWTSNPGQTYQLQYRDDLLAGTWTNFVPNVLATSTNTCVTNSMPGAMAEYYRVLAVP